MAKMIPLNPAPTVALPAEGWALIATEAGRYGDGLRATLHLHNGELQYCGQVRLAQPRKWKPFIDEVTSRITCEPPAIEGLIRQLTETIFVMLQPKPRPQPGVRAPTGRAQIQVNARFDREIISDAIDVLVGLNDPPTLFMRGSELVRVAPDAVQAVLFDIPRLRVLVGEVADCVTVTASEYGEETHPSRLPYTVCQDFLAMELGHAFPPLAGIRTAPVFLPGGRLLTAEGYDRDSGYLLRLRDLQGITTTFSIREALRWIFKELLVDFPFVEAYSQAHILALLLEPFARPIIRGRTPIYAIDASTRGSGKGLLADCASIIATGGTAPVMALTGESDEHDKRITALLMAGASWILLDNVTSLNSSALSAALTADVWRGRVLGASKMVMVTNDATWVATGNNIEMSSEMARRVIPIRLEPAEERPEERSGFTHAPLLEWARAHRADLVSACLSLVQAWVDAGQPRGTKILGSYESWASVIGGILDVAGIVGFLEGRESLHLESDIETADWRALCEHWWDAHQTLAVTTKDILAIAKEKNILMSLWAGRKEIAALQRMGHALQGMRGRIFGPHRVRWAGRDSTTKNAAYRLEPKGTPTRMEKRHATPHDPPIRGEGDPQTPETPQTVESRESSQSKTPPQNTRNTPSAGGVSGHGKGVSQKTPAVDNQKTADNSEASGVSGVLGCFGGLPPSYSEQQGVRGDDREEVIDV